APPAARAGRPPPGGLAPASGRGPHRTRPTAFRWPPGGPFPAAAAAVVAAAAAIVLAIWAVSLHGKLDRQQRLAAVLGDATAQRNELAGDRGTLVGSRNGDAVLLVRRLPAAPSGKTYEAWVAKGGSPRAAGTFDGGPKHSLLFLSRSVPRAATVLVTVEKSGGSDAPTTQPFLSVKNSGQS